ncbi:MAG TPA: hypothetical protein DCW90_18350 [Lachnospiraceae bacterium]|nr:hypothetical protein [Lachnospiraceae bacterium]
MSSRIIQVRGPFTGGVDIKFNNVSNYRYTHFGIQYPDALPLCMDLNTKPNIQNISKISNMFDNEEKPEEYIASINSVSGIEPDFYFRRTSDTTSLPLKISGKTILEFDDLQEGGFILTPVRDMPSNTIIEATIETIKF